MFRRFALVCGLIALLIASARTDPLLLTVAQEEPSPTPTGTAMPSQTTTLTLTPTLTATPSLMVSATATGTVTVIVTAQAATPTPTPTRTATAKLTATSTPSATVTPTPTSRPLGPTPRPRISGQWWSTRSPGGPSQSSRPDPTYPNLLGTAAASPFQPVRQQGPRPGPAGPQNDPALLSPGPTLPAPPPQLSALAVSSITRSSVTVTWSSDIPSTSEVDYGLDAGLSGGTSTDPSLVTDHRLVLTNLRPDTTYYFVAWGSSGGGAPGALPQASFVTTAEGLGPEVDNPVAQVAGTAASITWTTRTGIASQLEYGTTPNYQSSTLLQVFRSQTQSVILTGLQPRATYHYRIKSWDGTGFLNASDDQTFSTGVAGLTTLLGDRTIRSERVTLREGQALTYPYTAGQTGQASRVQLYVDDGSTASAIRVALYADANGGPGQLLAQASLSGPLATGWTSVDIPQIATQAGTRYWLAVLIPPHSGEVHLRDGGAGTSPSSGPIGLTAFPTAWPGQETGGRSALSAFIQQVPPSVALAGASDNDAVTGTLTLSALIDDDVPVNDVQFFADGAPIGAPLTTQPYSLKWDTTTLAPGQEHTLAVRATDAAGRPGMSRVVTIQVTNDPGNSNL